MRCMLLLARKDNLHPRLNRLVGTLFAEWQKMPNCYEVYDPKGGEWWAVPLDSCIIVNMCKIPRES